MPMTPLLLFALGSLILLLGGLLCWRQRRRLHRVGLLLAVLLWVVALLCGLLSVGLYQFQRWSSDAVIARLSVAEEGPQRYFVTLEADGVSQGFVLLGDEWQLDARLLRWRLPALLAGAPDLYRFERLSGRYRDIEQERHATRSVHSLADDRLPDLWQLRRRHPAWLPFVDADYGSAAYLPLVDGARFAISLGPRGGLVARPADADSVRRLREAGR
jgi:hypothetical protein